jgi:hypothetical protein
MKNRLARIVVVVATTLLPGALFANGSIKPEMAESGPVPPPLQQSRCEDVVRHGFSFIDPTEDVIAQSCSCAAQQALEKPALSLQETILSCVSPHGVNYWRSIAQTKLGAAPHLRTLTSAQKVKYFDCVGEALWEATFRIARSQRRVAPSDLEGIQQQCQRQVSHGRPSTQ